MFGRKGQGSLEYILLIGGAVMVAAIVIGLVVTSAQSTGGQVSDSAGDQAACLQHSILSECNNDADCIAVRADGTSGTPDQTNFRCVAR